MSGVTAVTLLCASWFRHVSEDFSAFLCFLALADHTEHMVSQFVLPDGCYCNVCMACMSHLAPACWLCIAPAYSALLPGLFSTRPGGIKLTRVGQDGTRADTCMVKAIVYHLAHA